MSHSEEESPLGYACHKCQRVFPGVKPEINSDGHVHCGACNDSVLEIIENEQHLRELEAQFPTNQTSSNQQPQIRLPSPPPPLTPGSTLEVTYRIVSPQNERSDVTQMVLSNTSEADRILRLLHASGQPPQSPLRHAGGGGVGLSSSAAPGRSQQQSAAASSSRPTRVTIQTNNHPVRVTFSNVRAGGGGGIVSDPFQLLIRSLFNAGGDGEDEANFARIQSQLLQMAGHSTSPTPENVISQLPVISGGITPQMIERDANFGRGCSICQDDFNESSDSVIQLPCQHYFHKNCILPWLQTAHTCPSCRASIYSQSASSSEE